LLLRKNDNWNKQENKVAEDEFFNNLVKYVRDEPNGVLPGTIGMIKAKIAKTLVEIDPDLLAPEKRDVLLEAVRAVYDRDHAVTITLTEQDLAAADMTAARTDDLPKA
jgi:lipoate-protein ligase A